MQLRVDNKTMKTPFDPTSLTIMIALGLSAFLHFIFFIRKRRDTVHGSFAAFCLLLLAHELQRKIQPETPADHWPPLLSLTLPFLMQHVEALIPRRWLRGMLSFTWAYVIPYLVILQVYPRAQVEAILPAMEVFFVLSLLATQFGVFQAWREGRRGSAALFNSLLLLMLSGYGRGELALLGLVVFLLTQTLLSFRREAQTGGPARTE
jgi:hypothetical protein